MEYSGGRPATGLQHLRRVNSAPGKLQAPYKPQGEWIIVLSFSERSRAKHER